MERPLAGRVDIGVAGFHRENLTPVLKTEPQPGHSDTAAHTAVVALDERDHVTLSVGRAQVDSVAVIDRWMSRVIGPARAGQIDELAAPGGIVLRDQPFHRHLGEGRISVEFRAVLEHQLFGLDHHMKRGGALEPHRAQVESLEDVQHLQRGDALAVGREFINVVPAIISGNRLDPRRGMVLEIGLAEPAAVGAHEAVNLVRDLAAIKGIATPVGQQLIGMGERRIPEDLALLRRLALLRQGFGGQASGVHTKSL